MVAMLWSCHDHGETWPWSCHDDNMAAMFLGMVVMIHGMIMVWLPCFPWFILWSWYNHHVFHVFFQNKWRFCQYFFQIVVAIYHYIAQLTGCRVRLIIGEWAKMNKAYSREIRVFSGNIQRGSFYQATGSI